MPNDNGRPTGRAMRPAAPFRVAMCCLLWAIAMRASAIPAQSTLPFDALEGVWEGGGEGFSTRLSYGWTMPGRILDAQNEVRGQGGAVLARYRGAYIRDPASDRWDFFTVGDGGELHRGRAWWQDGVLWHEATITGGSVSGYASAVRVTGDTMRYFARYSPGPADASLLATSPIVYARVAPPAVSAAGPLDGLRFMAGCWRADYANGSALEEIYTAPSPNLILGLSRFMRGGTAVQFEFSRITADSAGIALLPYPRGRPSEHAFRLTSLEGDAAVFEAPEHDFPKRIVYTRGADGGLAARIDGGSSDARAQEWRMRAVPCPGGG